MGSASRASGTPERRRKRPAGAAACLALAALLAVIAGGTGCGKKGHPEPPIRIQPEPVSGIRVRQVGDRVVLSFQRPNRRTDGTLLADDAELEILMTAREPAPRSPRELQDAPSIRWTVPHASWEDYVRDRNLEVALRLESIASAMEMPGGAAGLAGRSLSFVVGVLEPGTRRAAVSALGTLRVCVPPTPPAAVEARVEEAGIRLVWQQAPAADAGGVNLYRIPDAVRGAAHDRLTTAPVTAAEHLDTTYEPGRAYRYTARAVAAGSPACESAGAETAPVSWVDTFPPAPPQGLAVVEEAGSLRLFWRPSRDADLRGYRVHRADGPDGALTPLSGEPITATTWTDATAAPGVVYSYAVTALDGAEPPNESAYSERAEGRLEEDTP